MRLFFGSIFKLVDVYEFEVEIMQKNANILTINKPKYAKFRFTDGL